MRFMMIIFPKHYENCKSRHGTRPQAHPGNEEIQRATREGRRAARGRRPDPARDDERARHLQKRKINSYRRPVHRNERTGRRLLIQVKSREEALEWASRIPGKDTEMVLVRRLFGITDFPSGVQKKVAEWFAEGGDKPGQQ
jgi:hypothetical protein